MDTEINNGLKAFIALGLYFLVLDSLGLAQSAFLRIFNIVIILYFINKSIKYRIEEGRNFLSLFVSAFFTNLIAVIFSTISLALYISFFRGADHMSTLAQPMLSIGYSNLSVSQFSFAIFAEGFASGVVLSFGLMQFWKNRTANNSIS